MLSEVLLDPLRGRTRLWKVFWLYGFVANGCYSVMVVPFLPGSTFTIRVIVLGGLIMGLYQAAALWQCAYNSRSRSLGRLVRTAVAVSLMPVPWFIYVLIARIP
jgi:hypothetical protein